MVEKTLVQTGIMIRTYPLTKGLYYKEDIKEGKYFEKSEYKNVSEDAIISASIKEKDLKQEYMDENGELKNITLNKVGQTYKTHREILMQIPLYEKIGGKIDIKDGTQVMVLSSKDTATLDKVINKIETRVKEINKNNELMVFNYMP